MAHRSASRPEGSKPEHSPYVILVESAADVEDPHPNSVVVALVGSRLHVKTVLEDFNAVRVKVQEPDTGIYVPLEAAKDGFSEGRYVDGNSYPVLVVRSSQREVDLETDEGRVITAYSRDGHLDIGSVNSYLASSGLELHTINNAPPSLDAEGFTRKSFNLKKPIKIVLGPKRGFIKVATAYPAQHSSVWEGWRRLVSF
jgi:hypothetical protein